MKLHVSAYNGHRQVSNRQIPQTCIVTLQCTPQKTHDDKVTDPRIHRKPHEAYPSPPSSAEV